MPDKSAPDYSAAQRDFMTVLQRGPGAFPDGVFAGRPERALLGLKAHANTISHARLVALEDTYPKTRERLGDEAFNQLSRAFVERDEVMTRDMNSIGEAFGDYLAAHGVDEASTDLARIEWAWLQSYHAAEAECLTMQDVAGLDEQELLDLPLQWHPSLHYVPLSAPLAPELGPGFESEAPVTAMLLARPEAEVLLHPHHAEAAVIFAIAKKSIRMRNFLEAACEQFSENSALEQIFALVGAGALRRSISGEDA
ncbi:HvfC/BufC family peptide modification chaperone [Alterisphingorhabdus coralli]|uniref:DNA-binding domain-containing protein n=1 Tax=Alterisphingorhabdus coralli TaxID=3071408 RepID=A0AA97I107_9SPHN|nr:putative DNA-binding domain-containing protein [Parasphingorhabdus sp. SCSIO 66989]WOE76234.1 putative DNA-binding domain-containing protein [Parasphingorhabdus sp. SCSIO 66989]